MSQKNITHALISVSDKDGIIDFAKALTSANITLLSTGGTAKFLKQSQIPVIDISDFTGVEEMMDGRVKTLHPKIFGSILARGSQDQTHLQALGAPAIGLVVVNLYPFQEVISKNDCDLKQAIENIDIGGPSLLRAAAKNFEYTTAVVSKADYDLIISEITQNGSTTRSTRLALAKKVFAHVAEYDAVISNYFSALDDTDSPVNFPQTYTQQLNKKMDLRYGENPHQHAAFYTLKSELTEPNMGNAIQVTGKPLSYNNIADSDAALECVKQFQQIGCVIVKHANPCAVALGDTQLEAYQKAYQSDPTSAYGGIIAFNSPLQAVTIETILAYQFVEVIITPELTDDAREIAKQKPNLRILVVGKIDNCAQKTWDYKSVNGGILIQDRDNLPTPVSFEVVSKRQPRAKEMEDLRFAWQVVRFIKSNAIVYVKDKVTIGIGPGQMSRIFSAKIAALKAEAAELDIAGSVMASDAFIPFRDSVDEAFAQEITAIIQPGGSLRDKEVIAAADEHNLAMIFTHIRHFRH
ncbi:MAG: bifunctional phosphoribosylaminoimidazolecarboxamide formyltransferase/IMP cyclohydrolase [Gammaproteobacteria bacterium]|nr:bifunctional phosphoribosylaminoimidazolecarboxamide formyltransferase/IMP cyclohydrolase [Gammaproteobacteria bacterium]